MHLGVYGGINGGIESALKKYTPMLTVAECKNAKPKDQPFKLYDEKGLYLLIHPNGSKYWRLKYRVAGTEKLLALGVYPEVPLALARMKRDEARTL